MVSKQLSPAVVSLGREPVPGRRIVSCPFQRMYLPANHLFLYRESVCGCVCVCVPSATVISTMRISTCKAF